MIDKLPQPTEEELNMTGKHEYFRRILEMDLHKKLGIDYGYGSLTPRKPCIVAGDPVAITGHIHHLIKRRI